MVRRLLILVLVASALVAGAPAARAVPADKIPLTFGTYTEVADCDVGYCSSTVVFDGQFKDGDGSIKAVATLRWSGRDDVSYWEGTISSAQFPGGPCRVYPQSARVDPIVGVQHSYGVECQAGIDGGRTVFSYSAGRFFPLGF